MQAFARRVKRGRIINLLDCRIASYRSDAVPTAWPKSLADLTRLAALSWPRNHRERWRRGPC